LQLLRGELIDRAGLSLPRRLAGRPELAARALGPRLRAQALEAGERGAQVRPRVGPPTRATQVLAVQQPGPRVLEGQLGTA
jgi:hypothetical protein